MTATYFDQYHEQMAAVIATEGNWSLCYRQQAALVESLLEPGMTVMDVGCGASIPYDTSRVYAIGLDPSAASLARNTDVDEGIVGTAENIPLLRDHVDLVVAFYSLHHMTGQTARETYLIRSAALYEMRRHMKDGATLMVFEMCPLPWAATVQRWLWPSAKRLLGDRLDTYFWTDEQYEDAMPFMPMTVEHFDCFPFAMIAPIIGLPWLKIPRLLFPLVPTLYRWRKP
jgi:hypothetical protein